MIETLQKMGTEGHYLNIVKAIYDKPIENIIVNGEKRGCSGFVTNTQNGSCVYVNTERTCFPDSGVMYRYANDNKDFHGYHNRWTSADYDVNSLAKNIIDLLWVTPQEIKEQRI